MPAKLSALILTKNEQEMIKDCLAQLDFADEVIVLDQNSQDATREIASKFTDKIIKTRQEDFSINRNQLAHRATGDWLLYVDADERLSPELIKEIRLTINDKRSAKFYAYYIPRKNFILGTWLKHGGWWPDYVPRLIKRDKLIKWQGKIHESPKIEGDFGTLSNPIEHLTARSAAKMLVKSTKWAKIEAELYAHSTNPKVNIAKVLKGMFFEFTNRYFIKLGFLDGQVGFIAAVYQAVHRAMISAYLWELQENTRQKFLQLKNQ